MNKQKLKISMGAGLSVMYGVMLLLSFLVVFFVFQIVYIEIMRFRTTEVAKKNMASLSGGLEDITTRLNNFSKFIYSDSLIQEYLRSDGSKNVILRNDVNRLFGKILTSIDELDSIYLVSLDGDVFYRSLADDLPVLLSRTRDSRWYLLAETFRGRALYALNALDAFSQIEQSKTFSCIRMIYDLETQKPLGFLIVNMDWYNFQKELDELVAQPDARFFLRGNGGIIYQSDVDFFLKHSPDEREVHEDGITYLGFSEELVEMGGSLSGFFRVTEEDTLIPLRIAFLVLLLLNAVLLLIGGSWMSHLVQHPVSHLISGIDAIGHGAFDKIESDGFFKEFTILSEGINVMSGRIQSLLDQHKKDYQVLRLQEVRLLQEQLKPHFLYNTLDSAAALSLMDRHEDVRTLITSLARFYKLSLSGVDDIICLENEVDLVRQYFQILKIRYNEKIDFRLDFDTSLKDFQILRLLIQPLVENAVYHGIRPTASHGEVDISIKKSGDFVKISVVDNGIGILNDTADAVIKGQHPGLGLGGTIRRIRLFYGDAAEIRIESNHNTDNMKPGTCITLKLPWSDNESLNN